MTTPPVPTELVVRVPGGARPAGLRLRPWRSADADAVTRLCQDPAIGRWTAVPCPYTPADGAAFVRAISPGGWADGSAASFAVCDAGTDEVLASVTIRRQSGASQHGEVGFWCGAPARGQGVMTAATRAACRWAFEELGLTRIAWRADPGNEGSWRVAYQSGFRFEGTSRAVLADRRGGFVDAWVGGLLPGEVPAERVPLPLGPDPALPDGPVTVRRYAESDVEAWAALRGQDSTREWDGTQALERPTRQQAYHRLRVADVEGWMAGVRAAFGIFRDGQLAGHVAINLHHRRLGEIGWWLGEQFRGSGTATRGLRLATGWASSVGIERIEARIHTANGPSRALAERAGFRPEGRLTAEAPHHGRWEEGLLYALLTADG